MTSSAVSTEYRRVTDGRTDRQTYLDSIVRAISVGYDFKSIFSFQIKISHQFLNCDFDFKSFI